MELKGCAMKNQCSENAYAGELLTSLELMSMLSISSTTLWRHVKNGELPKPVYIGKRRYWSRATINTFINLIS